MASLAILLLLLARISGSIAISSDHYISRSSQQMIIASAAPIIIPEADTQSAQQPFLTSPSGSYAAYLRRAADNDGGLAGDACYVQIQQAGGEGSEWESDCTPVGGADACDLAFSMVGLELFAGGHSLWDTGVDANPATLSLDDQGDMSIVSKEGVTVWKASGEPWKGQQCGAAPVPASKDALPPLSAISAKLVTPPAATLAGTTGSSDSSLGDQLASPPPVDDTVTAPDLPGQPPVDTVPEQPLTPPPADVTPDLPNPLLTPPPAYTSPDSPDLPLVAPPPADVSPDLPLAPPPADVPLYSSPPPAAALPPFGIPLPPPPGTGETSPDTPLPGAGASAPPAHGEPGSPGGVPFSPVGEPHKQGSLHHGLPTGASPPLPDTLGPSGHGEGAGIPAGHGQPQQGVFGQQPQLVDGEGHPLPLEDSAGGWSRRERGRVAMGIVLAALFSLCSGFLTSFPSAMVGVYNYVMLLVSSSGFLSLFYCGI